MNAIPATFSEAREVAKRNGGRVRIPKAAFAMAPTHIDGSDEVDLIGMLTTPKKTGPAYIANFKK
jgi:hypothetical protein